jgi:hypothetical protein
MSLIDNSSPSASSLSPAAARSPRRRIVWTSAWLRSWLVPTLAVAVALLWWQHDVLRLPPCQDQAAGWWTEADYLASTGFDYRRLLREENHFMDSDPGPRSYMISVLPTLLALAMLAVPDAPTLIVLVRGWSFLLGAGLLVGLAHALVAGGLKRPLAVLFCTALATTPLFVVQLDLMGMDVPLTLVLLAGAALLWRGCWQAAALMSLAAFALKATGQLLTLAGITYLALRLALGWRITGPIERRREWWGLATHLVVLVVQTALIYWGDTSVEYLSAGDWPENLLTLNALRANTPDVAVLLAIALLLTALECVGWLRAAWRVGTSLATRMLAIARRFVFDEPRLAISWILVAGLFASSLQYIYTPRYVFCVMPFLYIILARPWLGGSAPRGWGTAGALALLIAANLANQEGRFCADLTTARGADVFEGIPGLTPRSCAYLERSREYLRDHRSNIKAFELLDIKYADHPIFVASPNVFIVSRPRLGHVERQLEVFDASQWTKALAGFREVMLRPEPPGGSKDPIFVWFGHARVTLPPREAGDEVIYDDSPTNPLAPLVMYIKHLPADVPRTARAIEDWYIARTWYPEFLIARVRERPDYLVSSGRMDRALAELDDANRWMPGIPELEEIRENLRRQRAAGSPVDASGSTGAVRGQQSL